MLLAFIPLVAAQLDRARRTMPALWVVSSFLVWGFFQIGGAPAAVTRFLIPEQDSTLKKAMVYSITFSGFIYV